jgi:hypothetical protein
MKYSQAPKSAGVSYYEDCDGAAAAGAVLQCEHNVAWCLFGPPTIY